MLAEVDWENILQSEMATRHRAAGKQLTARNTFDSLLKWEKSLLPQMKNVWNLSMAAVSALGEPAAGRYVSIVEAELLLFNPHKPDKLLPYPFSMPDYTVLLPENFIDLAPVLDQTFPVSQILNEKKEWVEEARIVHPILLGCMVRLIERDNYPIKAIRPIDNADEEAHIPATLPRPTLQ